MQIPVIRVNPAGWQLTDQLLTLREGQVYRAVVQQSEGQNILLNLGGAKITAQTALEMQPGQVLWLEAAQVSLEGVVLKAVAPPEASLPSTAPALAQSAAKTLGIAPTAENLKIVEVLMSNNLPVTAKAVEELRLEIKGMPQDKRDTYLQVRAWIKTINLKTINILEPKQSIVPAAPDHAITAKGDPQGTESKLDIKLLSDFLLGKAEPEQLAQALKLINQAEATQLAQPGLMCLWWQNGEQHGEVYFWFKDERKNNPLESQGIVVLHFYTVNLGQLWVQLSKDQNGLSMAVRSETSLGQKLFEAGWPGLKENLQELGYDVTGFSCGVEEVQSFIQLVKGDKSIAKYSGIDFLA